MKKIKKIAVSFGVLLLLMLSFLTFSTLIIMIGRHDFRFRIAEKLRRSETNLLKKEDSFEPDEMSFCSLSDLLRDYGTQSDMLVNAEHPIPDSFTADLAEYRSSGVMMNRSATEAFGMLSDAVLKDCGQKLYISSSYRTAEEQAAILLKEGENAAKVGSSEHQTGLALDVYVRGFAGRAFLKSEAGTYVSQNAWKYGFIIRYPDGKSDVTGIPYEPWHIRYVGQPHAEIIHRSKLTLEEYMELFNDGEFYSFGSYCLVTCPEQTETILLPTETYTVISISQNNAGQYLITMIRK